MSFERVQFRLEIPQIPQSDGFVRGTRGQDCLCGRIERDRVDGVAMLGLSRSSGTSSVGSTDVENLECDVVGDSTNKRRVEGVVLNVVDNRGMVGIGAGWTKSFVALGVCRQVPEFGRQYPARSKRIALRTKGGQSCPRYLWRDDRLRGDSN